MFENDKESKEKRLKGILNEIKEKKNQSVIIKYRITLRKKFGLSFIAGVDIDGLGAFDGVHQEVVYNPEYHSLLRNTKICYM